MSRKVERCPCGLPVRRRNAVVCALCWSDPERRGKALYARAKQREEEQVDAEAMRATRRLPRKDAFIPLTGERLVEMMQRGDW